MKYMKQSVNENNKRKKIKEKRYKAGGPKRTLAK